MKLFRKLLPHYVTHRNYIGKGNAEVMIFRHTIQIIFLAKIAYDNMPAWLMILAGAGMVAGFWFIGFMWDRLKGYHEEQEWNNKRNPFVKGVREKLK